MQFISLNMLYDFIQIIYSMRQYYTKVEYFSKHILFTTIYLLLEQNLNPRHYSKQGNNFDHFCTSYWV
jgi:hypothetical protein